MAIPRFKTGATIILTADQATMFGSWIRQHQSNDLPTPIAVLGILLCNEALRQENSLPLRYVEPATFDLTDIE